jgi:hypothetical protein
MIFIELSMNIMPQAATYLCTFEISTINNIKMAVQSSVAEVTKA